MRMTHILGTRMIFIVTLVRKLCGNGSTLYATEVQCKAELVSMDYARC